MIYIIQSIDDVSKILSVKEITVYGVLLLAIFYFWNENRQLKKDIKKVIQEHKNDIREGKTDLKLVLERYHQFVNDVKNIISK